MSWCGDEDDECWASFNAHFGENGIVPGDGSEQSGPDDGSDGPPDDGSESGPDDGSDGPPEDGSEGAPEDWLIAAYFEGNEEAKYAFLEWVESYLNECEGSEDAYCACAIPDDAECLLFVFAGLDDGLDEQGIRDQFEGLDLDGGEVDDVVEVVHEYSEVWGKFDLYGYCEDQDWKCFDNWSKNNLDKLPCELGGIDWDCWKDYDRDHPVCFYEDDECWKSYDDHYYPKPPVEEPPKDPSGGKGWGKFDLYGYCEEGDWKCWDNWSKDHLDKLPCANDHVIDQLCWQEYEIFSPPCELDDEKCNESHEKYYYGGEEPGKEGKGWGKFDLYGYCEEGDWKCWDLWTKDNLDKLPCPIGGVALKCWQEYEEDHPACQEEDLECKDSYF